MSLPRVVVAHDYFTQRGGAERVALALRRGLGPGPLLTSVVDPPWTFPDVASYDVRTSWLQRIPGAGRSVQAALPLLPAAWDSLHVTPADGDVVVASSTAFAHGVRAEVPKVVYCHNPPRWLYQSEEWLIGRGPAARAALAVLGPSLRRWDQRAAASATRYLANSSVVAARIRDVYGIEAAVVPPPVAIDADGPQQRPPAAPEPPYWLLVGRRRGYKNTAAACAAAELAGVPLVCVGGVPDPPPGRSAWSAAIVGAVDVSDAELRWLYAHATGLLAPALEDFGLTPVEAAAFGTPTVALAAGGYLDTVVEDVTGTFAAEATAEAFAAGIDRLTAAPATAESIRAHAKRFSLDRFLTDVRHVIDEVLTT